VSERHVVLGTAGHIDHGKSALVHALTGKDPDRLAEEKRRGITIELGFADLELAPGRVLSFVDVPGHERFVRQMVAGASGIDAVLLVVAADQGVQPQTREHLDICRLLGLNRGLVVLSKSDLVDTELLEVAALEVGELLEGSFLAEVPRIAVSSQTGQGLDELRAALSDLFEAVGPRSHVGVPRLPIDRSFVLRGFGSVVTGTLASGVLGEGRTVEVLPGNHRGRVRGLQVHHQQVEEVRAGQRAAVNLQGVDTAQAVRGSVVTEPDALIPTRRLWARLALLPGAPKSMLKGGDVHFHHGTCERSGRYRVFEQADDSTLFIELHLAEEVVAVPGDRFILRRPAPVDTAGGGVIVDAHPPRARDRRPELFAEDAVRPSVAVGLRLQRAGMHGIVPAQLAAQLGFTAAQLERELGGLRDRQLAVEAAGRWVDAAQWGESEAALLAQVDAFHVAEPLREGISREALRGGVCPELAQEAWRRMLEGLERRDQIRLVGEWVARCDHEIVLEGDDRQRAERIEGLFRSAGLDPPDRDGVIRESGGAAAAKLVDLLLARGSLVKLHDGKLFHAEALEALRARLREHARTSTTIDVATFKELAGVTRKNAIPLLEYLDESRATRRVGNSREILLS